jgi:hypothetical protein
VTAERLLHGVKNVAEGPRRQVLDDAAIAEC